MITEHGHFDLTNGTATFCYQDNLLPMYFTIAYEAATTACAATTDEVVCREAAKGIVFSAFAMECAANNEADLVPEVDRADFLRCRGKFKRPPGTSEAIWKWRHLLLEKGAPPGPGLDALLLAAQGVFFARNTIAHFDPAKAPTTITSTLPPHERRPNGDHVFHLAPAPDVPHNVKWGIAGRTLTPTIACRSYMAARAVLAEWHAVQGVTGRGAMPFPEIEIPPEPGFPATIIRQDAP